MRRACIAAGVLGLLSMGLAMGCGARTTLSVDEIQNDGQDGGLADAGAPAVPCASDAQCERDVCRARPSFIPMDDEPLPLVCGAVDAGGAPVGASCLDRGECDRGLCTISGACVMPCATAVDCASGQRCVEVWVRTSNASMQPLDACAPVVTAPDSVRIVGLEAGPDLPGRFSAIDDALPGLSRSTLLVWTMDSGTSPLLTQIRARDTREVFFDATRSGLSTPRWGVNAATVSDALTLLYPNGPNTPASPGGFDASLSSFEPSSSERIVLERDGEGSTFDIDAYLVGVRARTDGSLPPTIVQAIQDANVILSQVGLSIGEVRVHEVVGRLARDLEIVDGPNNPLGAPAELSVLYRLSAGAHRPSVHVFFVRMIDGAAGIASGIPGPHAIAGTGASGVAIGIDLLPPDWVGHVLVHEIGHFMGLFHTSELDGSIHEPLPDTGECGPDRDLDGDGFLLTEECEGAGADNVMFWAGQASGLSPQQGEVMRRAFFVH